MGLGPGDRGIARSSILLLVSQQIHYLHSQWVSSYSARGHFIFDFR